jgi:ribose transport system permease protein
VDFALIIGQDVYEPFWQFTQTKVRGLYPAESSPKRRRWPSTPRARLRRYAYAMGSNLEAARLSGIPIRRYLTSVYVISGALAGFGGMIAASRVNSGQPNFGIGLELDVIAAAVIGGASLFGGQGTVVGTLIGAFLVALIRNGSVLLDINTFYQQVIIGVVIWLAVIWDQYRRRRLAAASE